jgi:hypothetical protein
MEFYFLYGFSAALSASGTSVTCCSTRAGARPSWALSPCSSSPPLRWGSGGAARLPPPTRTGRCAALPPSPTAQQSEHHCSADHHDAFVCGFYVQRNLERMYLQTIRNLFGSYRALVRTATVTVSRYTSYNVFTLNRCYARTWLRNFEKGYAHGPSSYLSSSPPPPLHWTENPIYLFPEKKLHGLVPNSYIHISMSDLCILRIGLPV